MKNGSKGLLSLVLTALPGIVLAGGPTGIPVVACPGMTISVSGTDVLCAGGNSGTAQVNVTGGVDPLTFLWSTGPSDTTSSVTGLSAGTYSVIVTDSTGCSDTASITINQPATIILTSVVTSPSCPTSTDGAIDLSVSGGVSPYSYNWAGGPGSQDWINLGSGSYTVIVTDANNCSDTLVSTVTAPPQWVVSTNITDAACAGGNGSVDMSVSGATPPYTYSWSNGASSQDLNSVGAGTYTLSITDNTGCTFLASATVSEPGPVSANAVVTNVSCSGGNTGAIDLTPTGGTAPYSFSWSNGSSSEDISGLPAGSYTVTITDASGCTGTSTIMVNSAGPLTLTTSATNVSCNGAANGAINLTVTGGNPPFTYNWTNGATTEDLTSLLPGTYGVTVTDSAGCVNSTSVTITQPAALALSASPVHVQCNGAGNGAIDLTVTGGTSPYTYAWSNGSSSQDITGVPSGNYSVTVTDASNCTAVISVSITQPPVLALNSSVTNVSCNGMSNGSVNLLVSGGSAPYFFSWNNGASTEDLNGVIAGSYTVAVTDNNGCTAGLTVTVTQPAVLSLSTNVTNASCSGVNNGAIDLILAGGTGPFTYNWSNSATTEDLSGLGAGTYTVTVTDSKGCTGTTSASVNAPSAMTLTTTSLPSNCGAATGSASVTASGGSSPYTYLWNPGGQTTSAISNVASGYYSVVVTDNNGCVTSTGLTVGTSSGFSVTSTVTPANCAGTATGSVDITPSGGSGTYTYTWSNGAGTQDLTGVTAGTYAVTVSDGACSFFLAAVVTQPAALSLSANVVNPTCNSGTDGMIDITVNGGTTPYTYAWTSGQSTEDINGINAGTYTVTVTDGNGCTAPATFNLSNPPVLTTSVFASNADCNGAATGMADLTVFGGVQPYSYTWNTGATTQDLSGLTAGAYSVTVTDASGCVSSASGTITEPLPLLLSYNATNVSCNGGMYGAIDLAVGGGTPNYSYNWTGGLTSQDIGGLSGGVYGVLVTDANGCSDTLTITITEPDSIQSVVTAVSATCGNNDGSASVLVSGGVPPYTYQWNDPATQTTSTASNLFGGAYGVTVMDANGCFHSDGIVIPNAGGPVVTAVIENVSCNGANDGQIDLTVSGGTTPYGYTWSTGAQTQDVINLSPGAYFVTVSDVNGCTDTLSAFITEPDSLVISAVITDVLCNNDATGAIDVTVSGGVAPYNYFWTPVQPNSPNLSNLEAGGYTLQISDSNLCIRQTTFTVDVINSPLSVLVSPTNASCTGKSDGSVGAIVSGGTPPYTFLWNNNSTESALIDVPKGNYTLIVTDLNGCAGVGGATIGVNSELCDSLNIPTAFSPNGDGVNDVWVIRNIQSYSSSVVQIFNRWGSEIFSSNGYAVPWDGTFGGEPVPAGTYYYVVLLQPDADPLTGTVTIVR